MTAVQRFNETREWFDAIFVHDLGDSAPLSNLIRLEPIPPEYTEVVAEIIAGNRDANLKAAKKRKLLPVDWIDAASFLSLLKYMNMRNQRPAFVEEMADIERVEPAEMKKKLQALNKRMLLAEAESLGVSIGTVKNLIKEYEARLQSWPNI